MATQGSTTLDGDFTFGAYGAVRTASVIDQPQAFPVGSCVVIQDPTTGGLQPFVGQVTARNLGLKTLDILTLSIGTNTTGKCTSGSDVTFGTTVTGWASGPTGASFPLKVFWPTDPTLGVSPALGDGMNDDSTAINNALTLAADSPEGGIVMLPAGKFKCNHPLMVNGVGVHLWGIGREATVILQGVAAVTGFNPAVVVVTGKYNSLMHFTVQGIDGTTDGTPPTAVPPTAAVALPLDTSFGAGWAILGATANNTVIEDVHITGTSYGIAAIGFNDFKIRFCESEKVVGQYIGAYAQGMAGVAATATSALTIGGTPTTGDTLSMTLTDDIGFAVQVNYTLTPADAVSAVVTAASFAAAINSSAASSFVTASLSSAVITITARFPGTQGNSYALSGIAATGGVSITPTGTLSFTGGTGSSAQDFQVFGYQCVGIEGSTTSEAFHCDGGVTTFIVRTSVGRNVGYQTRVAMDNSGAAAHAPQQIELINTSSDHSENGMVFVDGGGLRIIDCSIGSTLSSNPAIDIRATFGTPTLGADATIENNLIDNNGAIVGLRIQVGGVRVRNNTISRNDTGIKVFVSQPVKDIQIAGNYISGAFMNGIDLGTVPSGSDWITIVGNTIYPVVGGTPILLPSGGPGNLGTHSRITDNPGYNPPDPGSGPSVPSTGLANAVLNPYLSDAMVAITPGSMATLSAVTLEGPDGTTKPYLSLAAGITGSTQVFVPVPCGYKIALTYTHVGSGKPSWNWIPT